MIHNDFLVRVSCMTYNHVPYIVDAMNGFTMQRTSFPYVCTIVDDASTDGEPEVINQYLNEHFELNEGLGSLNEETDDYILKFAKHKVNSYCYFAVLLLKYNHYSIRKSKTPYLQRWNDTKYVAICEGDDYWVDRDKLQIQIDFMSLHPDYSMCWHNALKIDAFTGKECGNHRRYMKDTTCPTEDIIINGGGFCPTASIVYINELRTNAPASLFDYHIGDYPLQLYMAFNGMVRYIDRPMSVYRVNVPGSWTTSVLENSSVSKREELWAKTIKLMDDFNMYSGYQYNDLFFQRKCLYLFYEYFAIGDYSTARRYWYKCRLASRPWSVGLVLSIHGFGPLVKAIKMRGVQFWNYIKK